MIPALAVCIDERRTAAGRSFYNEVALQPQTYSNIIKGLED
jgi:hypothetical protein